MLRINTAERDVIDIYTTSDCRMKVLLLVALLVAAAVASEVSHYETVSRVCQHSRRSVLSQKHYFFEYIDGS